MIPCNMIQLGPGGERGDEMGCDVRLGFGIWCVGQLIGALREVLPTVASLQRKKSNPPPQNGLSLIVGFVQMDFHK